MVLVALVHTVSSLGTTPYLGWNTSTACLSLEVDFPHCVTSNLFFEPRKSMESSFTRIF